MSAMALGILIGAAIVIGLEILIGWLFIRWACGTAKGVR